MAENTVSHHSCEELAVDPKILADGVIESILKWLPYESLVRFRTVCKDWNNLLSAHHFLSWRKENFKENPWLLIVSEGKYCHHLNVSAQVMKVFPVNNKVLASVGGLLLIPGRSRGKLFLYNPFTRRGIRIRQRREYRKEQKIVASNPARETFAQLPLPILSKQNGIRVGDILWKGNQYQVVAVLDNFIEVYNFSKQSWVIVHQLPGRIIEDTIFVKGIIQDIIFLKGLYFCTVRSSNVFGECEWSIMVLNINEDCASSCQMVHLSLSSPLCSIRKAPELVVCGSALVLITRDIFQLRLWELEYDNNNLSITSKLSWKAIATMPQEVLEFLYADIRKFVAGGNDIYFLSKASEKMGLFNKENGSWSCFQVDDTVDAYLYDPRPDISFQ